MQITKSILTLGLLGGMLFTTPVFSSEVEVQGVPSIHTHTGAGGCTLFFLRDDPNQQFYMIWAGDIGQITGQPTQNIMGRVVQSVFVLLKSSLGQEMNFKYNTALPLGNCHGASAIFVYDLDGVGPEIDEVPVKKKNLK